MSSSNAEAKLEEFKAQVRDEIERLAKKWGDSAAAQRKHARTSSYGDREEARGWAGAEENAVKDLATLRAMTAPRS